MMMQWTGTTEEDSYIVMAPARNTSEMTTEDDFYELKKIDDETVICGGVTKDSPSKR